jgi:hypothetical protein
MYLRASQPMFRIVNSLSIAGLLGRDMGKRSEVAAKIAANKQRVYRDRECITALEDFLDEATRNGFPKKLGDVTIP